MRGLTTPSARPLVPEADRLAQRLHLFLAIDFPFEELRERGIFDFIRYDRPDTDDPVEMARKALFEMFAEADRHIRLHALRRLLAFICSESGCAMPDAAALERVVKLLKANPWDQAAIGAWFDAHCR